jgi:hypothetical protein
LPRDRLPHIGGVAARRLGIAALSSYARFPDRRGNPIALVRHAFAEPADRLTDAEADAEAATGPEAVSRMLAVCAGCLDFADGQPSRGRAEGSAGFRCGRTTRVAGRLAIMDISWCGRVTARRGAR